MVKPITLYSHAKGPNPWKVAIILEELNIPYEPKFLDVVEMKKEPYLKICPNGRVPTIEDPNTGITLFESGAIIEYLAETYDTKDALSFSTSPEKFYQSQWIHFQMSEQGPYFGQASWFARIHPETIPSAIDRYFDQIKRVHSVLDRELAGKEYLVGDKCSIADLSFVTWDLLVPWIFGDRIGEYDAEKTYPNFYAWNQRLMARPVVQKVVKDREEALTTGH
ncbi:Glutathione S-transferase-like protein [Lachnellula subtilissima]|uniref:Glutathione S-transferase-like protein n=1 Tax=Lachnellula subtilissima TaxID=602034 RepID=A0A8H8RH65_9HELO|nr:Glutathione S-transferase-like protein [Lachnellula subtilissima]